MELWKIQVTSLFSIQTSAVNSGGLHIIIPYQVSNVSYDVLM